LSRKLSSKEFLEIQQKYEQAREHQKRLLEWGEEAYKFYIGGEFQWDEKDLKTLKEELRATFSINIIKSKVDMIVGYMVNNRFELKYVPVEGTDQVIADVFNQLAKLILVKADNEYYDRELFKHGLICGKAYKVLSINYDNDPLYGELEISVESPWSICVDPSSLRYDESDAEYAFRSVWLPKEKVKKLWPRAKIDQMLQSFGYEDKESIHTKEPEKYETVKYPFYDSASDKLRIDEYWYKEYDEYTLYVDTSKYEIVDTSNMSPSEIKSLSKQPHIRKVRRLVPRVRVKTICGNIELDDKPTPFTKGELTRRFPFIPFCAYRLRWSDEEYIYGLVRNLQDPQREKNKRRTQLIDIISHTPFASLIWEQGALTAETKRKMQEKGLYPGLPIEISRGKWGRFQVVNPPAFPQGILMMEEISTKDMDLISIPEMPSQKVEAGIALLTKERQVLTGVADIFDNFRLTQKIFGRCLIGIIQQLFDYEKTIRVIAPNGAEQLITINKKLYKTDEEGIPLIDRQGNFIIDKIENDISIAKLDLIVSEVSVSPSYRLAIADTLSKLVQTFPLPGLLKAFLYYLDLPSDVRNIIEQETQLQAQQVQQNPQLLRQMAGRR